MGLMIADAVIVAPDARIVDTRTIESVPSNTPGAPLALASSKTSMPFDQSVPQVVSVARGQTLIATDRLIASDRANLSTLAILL